MSNISFWTNTWNKLIYGWNLTQVGDILLIIPDTSHWSINQPPEKYFNEEKFAQQVKEKKVKAIIYKGTDANKNTGYLFTDDTAKFWWKIGEKFKLLRGCYHWLQYSVDPKVSFAYHNNFEKEYPTEFPYILDFEEPSVTNFSDYLWRARVWLGLANEELGDDVSIVYSGIGYLNKVRGGLLANKLEAQMGWLRENYLWLAFYSRYSPEKYMQMYNKNIFPWQPSDWIMWQYSFGADYPYYVDGDAENGTQWGITSKGLDMSYVKITWLQKYLDKFQNGSTTPEVPEEPEISEPPPTTEDGMNFLSLGTMNIRSGPGLGYKKVELLPAGTKFDATDIGGNNCWVKMDRGWVCKSLNGKDYLMTLEV